MTGMPFMPCKKTRLIISFPTLLTYIRRFNLHAATLFPDVPSFRESYVPSFEYLYLILLKLDLTNAFRLNRVIDEMRRLIEKYPGGYEDWLRRGAAITASTAQDGSEVKAKAPAPPELDQSLQIGSSKVAVADANVSIVNGAGALFEAPGIIENVLSTKADTRPALTAKDAAEPATNEQAPRMDSAVEQAPAPKFGERILKKPAAGSESSTADVTVPIKRPPTVPIPLPFAPPATSPLATSIPAVADPSSALPTLPATTFNRSAGPTLSLTPPTPLTPRGPRASAESPLIDSPGPPANYS